MKTSTVCAAVALALASLSPSRVAAASPEATPTPDPPLGTAAHAGTSLDVAVDSTADRRAAFEAGSHAIAEKRWEDAHRIFSNLWKGQQSYDVALHLGQVEFHLKRFREAATHLAYGMMLLPPREKPEIAERGRAILALCQREVGTLELRVKNKGATVLVDGTPVAEAPLVTDLYVEPGKHHFVVQLQGHEPETWDSEFVLGGTQHRVVQLKPRAGNLGGPQSSVRSDLGLSGATTSNDMSASHSNASWVPVIVGGSLSLVGVGVGVGLALLRGGLTDDATALRQEISRNTGSDSGCAGKNPDSLCDRLQKKNSDYDAYGTLEAVGFAVGGAALIATTTYFFLARPDQNRAVSTSQSSNIRLDGSFGKSSAGLQIIANF